MLKLRNPGWPPEGASGSPVSVLMPGHKAPEDEQRATEAESKQRGAGLKEGRKVNMTQIALGKYDSGVNLNMTRG